MNEKLNQCCIRLIEETKAAEKRLAQVGHALASATETGVEALEPRLKKAMAECESSREHAAQAGHRIKEAILDFKNSAVGRLEEWKTDRAVSKLEKHADKKERHATDAIVVAAFALLEAEVAIVEALKARTVAVEVAG